MKSLFLTAGAALIMASSAVTAGGNPPATATMPAATTQQTVAGGAAPAASTSASADIISTAQSAGDFSTLTRAIEAAGMTAELKNGSYVTLFAPTDAAFAKLPAGTVDNLLKPENREQLKALLANHMVPGFANAEFLGKQDNVAMNTVGGGQVTVDSEGGAVTVSGARVVKADVMASNGLIHAIDTVILPAG